MNNDIYDISEGGRGDVLKITGEHFEDKNFNHNSCKNKQGLLKFYAPWCPHCQNKVSDIKFLAKHLQPLNFFVGAVDIETNTNLAKKFEITGIPQFFLVEKNGVSQRLNNFQFNMENILAAICNFTSPGNKEINCKPLYDVKNAYLQNGGNRSLSSPHGDAGITEIVNQFSNTNNNQMSNNLMSNNLNSNNLMSSRSNNNNIVNKFKFKDYRSDYTSDYKSDFASDY